MVSDKQLMNYAMAILAGKDGYTLEEVLKSFPRYYAAIVNYMNWILLERQKKELDDRFRLDYNLLSIDYLEWKQSAKKYNDLNEAIKEFESEELVGSIETDLQVTYLQLELVRQGQKLLKHKLEINKYYGLYNDQVERINKRLDKFAIEEKNLIDVIGIIKEQMFGGDDDQNR